jgi:DNA-binding phage protein
VTDGAAATSGVPHEDALLVFAEAMVRDDEDALVRSRKRILEEMGPEALVDAAAVVSNFERMVRIADSTGIPLDSFLDEMTADIRADLNLVRFAPAKVP